MSIKYLGIALVLVLMVGLAGVSRVARAGVGQAAAPHQEIERFKLANGLNVILSPIGAAEKTALVVLYSIGSDQDPKSRSGLAHLIEHLYFTAAAGNQKARTADKFIERYQGEWNAQTGDQYTVIAVVFSSAGLEKELLEAASRMSELRITSDDIAREKPRISFELGNTFGGPQLAALNSAREMARPTPLGGRRGGVLDQLGAISVEEAQAWWQRYYKPLNATVVLAGALDVSKARQAVTDSFGKISGGQKAPAAQPPGKPRLGSSEKLPSKATGASAPKEVWLCYPAPGPGDKLYPAFLALTSRLLFDSGKITLGDNSPVQYAPLDDSAVLYVNTPVKPGETSKETQTRLEAFVAASIEPKPSGMDVKRVEMFYGTVFCLTDLPPEQAVRNPYAVAYSLGRCQQLGIDSAEMKALLGSLTASDLARAARAFFTPERHSTVMSGGK
jgi:zinc protease